MTGHQGGESSVISLLTASVAYPGADDVTPRDSEAPT